jgi:hypothetical protein
MEEIKIVAENKLGRLMSGIEITPHDHPKHSGPPPSTLPTYPGCMILFPIRVLLVAFLFGWCNAYGATLGLGDGNKPYNLVVVGVFKNESWILGEWIQHYIDEGVDHFYLVDNGSRDNYQSVLLGFSDTLVTVVRDGSPHQQALQDLLMNKYFTRLVSEEAQWVLVVDIDEYLYARFVYVYMYVCTYINIDIHTYINMYIHTYTHIHAYIHTY